MRITCKESRHETQFMAAAIVSGAWNLPNSRKKPIFFNRLQASRRKHRAVKFPDMPQGGNRHLGHRHSGLFEKLAPVLKAQLHVSALRVARPPIRFVRTSFMARCPCNEFAEGSAEMLHEFATGNRSIATKFARVASSCAGAANASQQWILTTE
jgi:hypothetical protein